MTKYLIVGVDPGTTTAVAVLDFAGNVVKVHSSKDVGISGVIDYVMSLGKPSLVASDVSPPPDFVSKVASKFGAVLYSPEESLTVREKLELTRGFDTVDAHQRDALASALTAYAKFRNKFEKIDSLGLGDEVKHMVLRGISIEKASTPKTVEAEPDVERKQTPEPALSAEEKKIRVLEKRVGALLTEIEDKSGEVLALRSALAKAQRESRTGFSRDREIQSRENTIRSLKSKIFVLERGMGEISELKRLLRAILGDKVLVVGVYPEIFGGATYVKKVLNKKEIAELKDVKVFFTDENRNKKLLEEEGFTVADAKALKRISDFHYINKKDLEKIKENKRISIEKLIDDYRMKRE